MTTSIDPGVTSPIVEAAPKPSRTQRIAHWSATHPWTAIAVWFAMIAALTSLSFLVDTRQATTVELGVGESGRATAMADDAGYVDLDQESVLITARSGDLDAASAERAAQQVTSAVEGEPIVRDVVAPIPSADGSAVQVPVLLTKDTDGASEDLDGLEAAVKTVQADHTDLRVELVGPAIMTKDFNTWLDKDLGTAGALSLPVTLVVLLLAFGAVVMAGIPLVLGVASVVSAFGLWAVVSQVVPDPGMVMHVILLIGLAVGVDYSLFYVRRFREERARGLEIVDSVQIAAATAGHSVLVSGTAVALTMAGLLVVRDAVFTGMAVGAILVVIIALVSALTVLPAMLVELGRFSQKPRVPVVWRLSASTNPRLARSMLRPVVNHPVVAMLLSVVALGTLALPALTMTTESTQVSDFPRSLTSMQAYDRWVAAYPDNTAQDTVVVTVPADRTGELDGALARLSSAVAADAGVYGEVDQPWISPDGRTAVVGVQVPHDVHSDEGRASVTTLRDTIVPESLGAVSGAETAVGGDIAEEMDYTSNVNRTLPLVIGVVIALTFVIMLVAFRSVTLSLITAALNLLSVGATLGLLVLIFQHTWAEGLLDFTSSGHVIAWVPILLFVILSGLSMDYHIFVVSRIQENALHRMSPKAAVLDGIGRTAGVVTAAAMVMVAVFSIFGMLSFIELKEIGVGLALGVLIDATIIRGIALPSMILVFHKLLWWGRNESLPRTDAAAEAPVRASQVEEPVPATPR